MICGDVFLVLRLGDKPVLKEEGVLAVLRAAVLEMGQPRRRKRPSYQRGSASPPTGTRRLAGWLNRNIVVTREVANW